MATDPIYTYLEARRALQAVTDRVTRMVRTIQDAEAKLRAWDKVCIANCGVEFPAEVARGRRVDAKEWPTAAELAKALVAWHEANRAAQNAWRTVRDEERIGLQPPL